MLQPQIITMFSQKRIAAAFHSYTFTDLAGLKLDWYAPFHHTAVYKGLNTTCICQITPLFYQVTSTLDYYLLIFVLEDLIFTEKAVCAHQCGIFTMVHKRI